LGWFSTTWRGIGLLVAGSLIVTLFVLLIPFISLN
jgi:hypothetical protein